MHVEAMAILVEGFSEVLHSQIRRFLDSDWFLYFTPLGLGIWN